MQALEGELLRQQLSAPASRAIALEQTLRIASEQTFNVPMNVQGSLSFSLHIPQDSNRAITLPAYMGRARHTEK